MSTLDWLVLCGTILLIVAYGVYKGRGSKNIKGYLLSNNDMKWYTITISIMATQASAITFLSTPGQAYVDGMRFVQFYLGLPIAMIVLSVTAVPIYHKLKVYTAYEYLETKFDIKTRALAAFLFLIQRGLAAGLTIYAPSLILSVLLGWDLYLTNLIVGGLVIVYTTTGGAKAVGWTQFHQMIVITIGMFTAFGMILYLLPENISVIDSIKAAGKMGKLESIDFTFDLDNRYSFWSGLIGGLFLQLSYFGTDQSQVQRYLTGQSITQSRLGLLVNGIVKIPMQFIILFIGAMLFMFYQFTTPPLFFNPVETEKLKSGNYSQEYYQLEKEFSEISDEKKVHLLKLIEAMKSGNENEIIKAEAELDRITGQSNNIRTKVSSLVSQNDESSNANDTNYIFLTFVLNFLPVGLVGLVLAAILSASMSSTSSEINALASTSVIDVYKRMFKREASDRHYLLATKLFTVLWGLLAILFAEFANHLGSLIEAVNILGSLFYGTILGIFLLAFYFKGISGTSAFIAAIAAEAIVILCFVFTDISFLWYNLIGCMLVILLAFIINPFTKNINTLH